MDLAQLRVVQLLAFVGSVAGILSLIALWGSPYRITAMVLSVVLSVFALLLETHRDRTSVFFAGVRKLYSSFPPEKNREVFKTVLNEYCYLGIGFTSVASTFRAWYESERKPNTRIRILLTDPDATDALEFQARYENNLFKSQLSQDEQQLIQQTVKRAQDGIRLTVDLIKTLSPASPPVEVRFHREKLRKWIHLVNGDSLYLGILRAGVSGLNSPTIVLKPVKKRWGLFDHHFEEFQTLWDCSASARTALRDV